MAVRLESVGLEASIAFLKQPYRQGAGWLQLAVVAIHYGENTQQPMAALEPPATEAG